MPTPNHTLKQGLCLVRAGEFTGERHACVVPNREGKREGIARLNAFSIEVRRPVNTGKGGGPTVHEPFRACVPGSAHVPVRLTHQWMTPS